MNAQPDVNKLIQQTQRYEFSDGLRDLQLGLMMPAMGIMTWIVFDKADLWLALMVGLAQRFGAWGRWSILIIALLPGLVALAALLVIRYVRRRWLWRDTGYVRPKQIAVPFHVSLISVIIMLGPLGLSILLQRAQMVSDTFMLRVLLVASGWAFGYTLADMGHRLDLMRYTRVGLWTSLITAPLLALPITVGETALLWGLVWGVALSLSGISPLRNAVHHAREVQHE